MPLTHADLGKTYIIERICGRGRMSAHLRSMGLSEGVPIQLLSHVHGNFIITTNENKIAINEQIAHKIRVRMHDTHHTHERCHR